MEIELVKSIPDGLINLIEDFIIRANEYERTPLSILSQINDVLQRGGGLWIIRDVVIKGYAFAEVMPNEYGTKTCLVHELYMKGGDVKQMDIEIGNWGRAKGASEMAFFTRRNPAAFKRILYADWRVDSTALKRVL